MNARFWVWHNGSPVKLTLENGKSLSVHSGGQHEEGFSASVTTWTFDGEVVTRSWADWGRDCDGRHESSGEDCCPIDDLHNWENEMFSPGIKFPKWEQESYTQRDHTAESMNY